MAHINTMAQASRLETIIQLDSDRMFRFMIVCCRAGVPFFIWGPPGIGKSALMRRLARYFGARYHDFRLLLKQPTEVIVDFNVDPKTGEAKLARASWIPTGKEPTIVGVDEYNAAPRTTQAAMYEPFLDHTVGGNPLPDNCYIGAAGNREQDRGVTEKMPTPARLRMVHGNLVTAIQPWNKWAAGSANEQEQVEEFPIRKHSHQMHPFVIAFNAFTGGRYLDQLGNAKDDSEKQQLFAAQTFSSARGMEFLSKLIEAGAMNEEPIVTQALYAGTVGLSVASEFQTFIKNIATMPDVDECIASPAKAPVPPREAVGTLYALTAALAQRMTGQNMGNILKYLDRLPSVEFNVYCVRNALRRDISLAENRSYAQWVARHQDVGGW